MSLAKVIIDYNRETDDGLLVLSSSVYAALQGNTNFTWKVGELEAFQQDITDYNGLLDRVVMGSSADVIKKNLGRAKLLGTMRNLANEVNFQAKGDVVKLQSSGFRLVKTRSKVGVLPKPTGFEVSNGDNSGSIICSVDANQHAKVYLYYIAMVPAPASIDLFKQISSPTRKTTIKDLIPGKQYEIKCAYQGSEIELIYSDSLFVWAT